MIITVLKSKLHRARVTGTDIDYEGSIAIDTELIAQANMFVHEYVDIYNVTTGARFSTYIIPGSPGEISLNGAAARLVMKGDTIIIASYTQIESDDAATWKPTIVLLDTNNKPTSPR